MTATNEGGKHERFAELVSRGFDAGNYANAYETQDYEKGLKKAGKEAVPRALRGAYLAAYTMGFFGSYELSEMGEYRGAYLEAYRSEGGQACLEAGYCDRRDASELEGEDE